MPMRFVVWLGALCGGGASSRSPPCFTERAAYRSLAYRITVVLGAACSFVLWPSVPYRSISGRRAGTGSRTASILRALADLARALASIFAGINALRSVV